MKGVLVLALQRSKTLPKLNSISMSFPLPSHYTLTRGSNVCNPLSMMHFCCRKTPPPSLTCAAPFFLSSLAAR
eukprot:c502_g1_i1 orf=360-578(+)